MDTFLVFIFFSSLKLSSRDNICYLWCLYYRYKKQVADPDFKLKKVYFYWICPDTNAFEWLHDLLRYYDKQMAETGFTDFLKYFVYLTRGWDRNLVFQLFFITIFKHAFCKKKSFQQFDAALFNICYKKMLFSIT